MKRLFLFLSFLFALHSSYASHMVGGEITWECDTNGAFIFKMKTYRDCNGIQFTFNNSSLDVLGGPLPRDSNGIVISSILLKPDSAKWLAANRGDISPNCFTTGRPALSCSNGDNGAFQEFPYKSDPIFLNGIPPSSGWQFVWTAPCCRNYSIENLDLGGTLILRAVMYPNRNNDPVDNCYNSSPRFAETLDYYACLGEQNNFNHGAIDNDNDSLVYSFERTYNSPNSNPTYVPYSQGYNFDNPTPDRSFDSRNVPASLNPQTGMLSFKTYTGRGGELYWVVIRVDEYRDSTLVSSIFREFTSFVGNCPSAQLSPALRLLNWSTQLDELANPTNTLKVQAGDKTNFYLRSIFTDSQGRQFDNPSDVNIRISSPQFSASLSDSSFCNNPPCMEFNNSNINLQFDSVKKEYSAIGVRSSALGFIDWQTQCNHLDSSGGSQLYPLQVITDYQRCDTIVSDTFLINIEVGNQNFQKPTLPCVSDGDSLRVRWSRTGIRIDSFVRWDVYSSRPNGQYSLLANIPNYSTNGSTYNTATLQKLDSAYSPSVYIKAVHQQCNYATLSEASDTATNFATISKVANYLEVQLSKPRADEYTFRWYTCDSITGLNDSLIGNGNAVYVPQQSGYYRAAVYGSPQFACGGSTDCIYFEKPVGLSENTLSKQIKIYPNPNQGIFTIENQLQQNLQIKLFNLNGQLVQQLKAKNRKHLELDLNAPAGIYFLEISNQAGERVFKKIVKR